MKKLFIVSMIYLSVSVCDPPHFTKWATATQIEVIDAKRTLSLGDSIALYFTFPDTVELLDKIEGGITKKKLPYSSSFSVGILTGKVDSTRAAEYIPFYRNIKEYANPGRLIPERPGTLLFYSTNGKLYATYYLIPQEKGIYIIEFQQGGSLSMNGERAGVRLSFGAIDRNDDLFLNAIEPSSRLINQARLADIRNRGLDFYTFEVK
jgi:hypothetical protein